MLGPVPLHGGTEAPASRPLQTSTCASGPFLVAAFLPPGSSTAVLNFRLLYKQPVLRLSCQPSPRSEAGSNQDCLILWHLQRLLPCCFEGFSCILPCTFSIDHLSPPKSVSDSPPARSRQPMPLCQRTVRLYGENRRANDCLQARALQARLLCGRSHNLPASASRCTWQPERFHDTSK